MSREADKSHKWTKTSILCHKCSVEYPPSAFIVHRITGDFIGNTCQRCQVVKSGIARIRATVSGERQRAIRRGVVSTLTADEWIERLDRSQGVCSYCGVNVGIDKLTIDHIIPLGSGGQNTIDNVTPACWPCNLNKGEQIVT
jgi:5-methylcytosine-specific restriction endonuclease McrA